MKKMIIAAVIAVAAAACGGSGLPTDATGAPKLSAVAASIGCTDLKPLKPAMFASKEGTCKLNGRDVDLATFASHQLKQNWEKVGESGFEPLVKDGPGWVAFGSS